MDYKEEIKKLIDEVESNQALQFIYGALLGCLEVEKNRAEEK